MRILHAPTLGWRNVDLHDALVAATGLPVQMENSGRACALAQLWTMGDRPAAGDLVFVSVSDGVGVIVEGELLRGRHNIAGEFGHVPLSLDGPRCACGSAGCWEAYISNRATLARYFGRAAASTGPMLEFAGRAAALHEYLIGVEAMGRPMAYSPEEVYARELTDASVRIDVPKGSYVPRFLHVAPSRVSQDLDRQ